MSGETQNMNAHVDTIKTEAKAEEAEEAIMN